MKKAHCSNYKGNYYPMVVSNNVRGLNPAQKVYNGNEG